MTLGVLILALLAAVPEDDGFLLHVLNRLTWGPAPGDLERLRARGYGAWLEEQLHPDRIRDAKAEARVAALPTAGLDTAALRRGYEVPSDAKREIKERLAAMAGEPTENAERALRREMFLKLAPRMEGRPQQVIDELQEARLLRAVHSERQLQDVLADFWMNHFNVFAGKGVDRYLLAEYEREAIRPRVLGRFEDLLRATARSPAMLFYLDNWVSAAPGTDVAALRRRFEARAGGRGASTRRASLARTRERPSDDEPRRLGLNENYARELLELHTLGVDGGYTQQDVVEVARCFTGWTLRGLREDGVAPAFVFVPFMHAPGDKRVLGQRIESGGQREGEQVLRLLSRHPSTARFVATKLARRFVADEPPPALVERLARVFLETDGDLRAVVRGLALSAEFRAPEARGAKTKTPLEFVASALRASGASLVDAREAAGRLEAMGMPLYMAQAPTGYKDTADAWVSASGLLARLNFALDLAGGRLPGALFEGAPPSGLLLGSPDFQRR
jgi:uncharacterized protein (DUF1800 family)